MLGGAVYLHGAPQRVARCVCSYCTAPRARRYANKHSAILATAKYLHCARSKHSQRGGRAEARLASQHIKWIEWRKSLGIEGGEGGR